MITNFIANLKKLNDLLIVNFYQKLSSLAISQEKCFSLIS